MIAASDLKHAARIGKLPLLHVFHPRPVHSHGDVVLGLARDGAGVTTDAFTIVDDESVLHRVSLCIKRTFEFHTNCCMGQPGVPRISFLGRGRPWLEGFYLRTKKAGRETGLSDQYKQF
jgi:hypothetical protein